jgi:Fe-S-cluster containining protein
MGRAEYRRDLKEDQRLIAAGLDATQLDGRQVVALMRVLRDKLRTCIERRSVTPMMYFIAASLDQGAKHLSELSVACRRGCSHCCHIWVDALAPEVFYALKSLKPQERLRAQEAVEQACGTTLGRSFDARAGMITPCPLLLGNECSVYNARPINCRTAVSVDAEICRRSYREGAEEDIPTPFVWIALRQGYGVALEAALRHAGLAHRSSEWNESLRLVLAEPDAEARWLGGKDVFSSVPRVAGVEIFDHPLWRGMYEEAFGESPIH